MRADWHALHEHFLRTIDRHQTHEALIRMRTREPALQRFRDPAALLDWMHGPERDHEAKDVVLAAIVREAQADGAAADLAFALIHLALWPGLDAVYRKRLRHFRTEPDTLVSEIAARFLAGVRGMDLSRVNRIAATLVRNIDRDIGRLLQARWREAGLRETDAVLEKMADETNANCSGDEAAARLLSRIEAVAGPDAGLVIDVVLRGLTQREAAEARGLSHEAGRKRYQRALARLRTAEVVS